MREIKFRAWDKKDKWMILEALEIRNIGLGEGSVLLNEDAQKGNELIWMQFTGLLDKNGKEIYHSDWIEWSKGRIGTWLVEWRDGAFWAQANGGADEMLLSSLPMSEVEIVGNLYEHEG